jgi:hypothetical protein
MTTQVEQRSGRRNRVDISVGCSRATADPDGPTFQGRSSSSRDGLCVEVGRDFAAGTVLTVRAVRQVDECLGHADIPSLAVAEARWSHQHSSPPEALYRIGLQYLML